MGFGRTIPATLLGGLAACTVEIAAPLPSSVEPSRGYNGEETAVTIVGERFWPQVEIDATGTDRTQVNAGFSARLERGGEEVRLEGVSLDDFEHLRAIVPPGLEPGVYDLVVVGPTGQEGPLPDAFTVTDTRADRIRVDSDSVVYEVYEVAWLDVALVDPRGEPVLADLEVVVVVTDDAGTVIARFEPDGLDDQQAFGADLGIIGRLGDDGQARIGFTLEVPDTVDVVVSPGPDASQVAEGTIKLRFDPGSDLAVDVVLPEEPLTVVAGETFPAVLTLVDQFGNPVPGASELVVLKDLCDSFVAAVPVEGAAVVDVTLGEATGTVGCPVDRLVSIAGPPGASSDITVLPGPVAAFDVRTSPAAVIAGEADLDVVITPVDAFGNAAAWAPSALTITDTVGGVVASTCGEGVPVFCTITSVVASSAVRLRVQDVAGVQGVSAPYAVRPGAPFALDVLPAAGPAVAGAPLPVKVRVLDAWSNQIPGAVPAASVVWTSPGDHPACAVVATDPDGTMRFGCASYVARPDATLRAEVFSPPLLGESGPFEIVNGPLARVEVTPDAAEVVAGEPLGLSFAGFDAWDNPFVVQDDPVVGLADTGGTLSLASVTLDAAGEGRAQGSFTRAGLTEVLARRGTSEVGRSGPIAVGAAGPDALVVDPGAPWVWVGDEVEVSIAVVDAFGNVADWAGTATVSTDSGEAGPAGVGIAGGRGVGTLVWDDPVLADVVRATAPGPLDGDAPLVVVRDCPVGGPTAVVTFGGEPDARVCLDAGGQGAVVASLGASTPGASAIALRGVRAGSTWATSASTTIALEVTGAGRTEVEALVAGEDGCGDAAAALAWAGPDDGSPVGPIAVEPADATLAAGLDTTTVALAATDCTRDLAAGALVRVRVDRGALGAVTPTGTGLGATLDAAGEGTVILDASGVDSGGPAEIVAWAPGGAAFGGAPFLVVDDFRRPVVWGQTPSGATTGAVDTVVLDFSEPLRALSVVPEAFSVTGPAATSVVGADLDGAVVTLTLDPPVDAGSGAWTVTASSEIRDVAGNRLDGAGTGTASPWVGRFGDLPPAVDPVSACAPSPTTFRPDGDDGEGVEADEVAFTLASNTAPHRWEATVYADDVVLRALTVPTGPDDRWTWDGRDAGGAVVGDGAYVVTIDALDADGNRGGACTAVVTVQQHAGSAP